MPELPEVEHARRCLLRWLGGQRLTRVEAPPSRLIPRPGALRRGLSGARLVQVERRGKQLLLTFQVRGARTARGLAVHLGMSGRFRPLAEEAEPPAHTRLLLGRRGLAVAFIDPRMFGHVELGPPALLRERHLAPLGPDLLDEPPDGPALAARLGTSGRAIKELLLDQGRLAGAGNIQASEALFRARLAPTRPGRSLRAEEWRRMARAIARSLGYTLDTLERGAGRYLSEGEGDNVFLVYDRAGEPCPRCRTPILRRVQGGRATFSCPRCQPAPP